MVTLAALIVCLCGGHPGTADRGVLCCDFYPLVFYKTVGEKSILESRKVATNYEECIGKEVRVFEEVDNRKESRKSPLQRHGVECERAR